MPNDLLSAPSPDRAIVWDDRGLSLLDQRILPHQALYLSYQTAPAVAAAIRDMVVRGAPAIGITAAYGLVLAVREHYGRAGWRATVAREAELLAQARPTAVNLAWALARMGALLARLPEDRDPRPVLLAEALAIHREDVAANRRMGELGAALIQGPTAVITHCNAGALATGGYGTALGVVRSAFAAGRISHVYADETRPWLQGARLTAWELHQDGIPVTLMADGAAAARMGRGGIGWVIVGADRVAANGDVANKIGTFGLAVAARYQGVGFMVVAPISTLDLSIADGSEIPVEQRSPDEVLGCGPTRVGAPGVGAWNPAFDVTPAALVDALVTERGVVLAPDRAKLAELCRD
jgi:methylthioribose-1-phosphate isomerase